MIAGTRRFDSGIEGEKIRLVGNVFDDGDLGGNLFHGRYSLLHGCATFLGRARAFFGYLFDLTAVFGVLGNGSIHLLQARTRLFHGCCLFARALRQTL